MPRKQQEPLTEEEKFKQQEQLEQELGCLQRQYTLLEKGRHLYACGVKLGRLNKVLSVYKKENANIEADLEVASAAAKKREDEKDTSHLAKHIEDHDFYEREVKKQRQYIQEIEAQIQKVEKEVIKLRSQQITDRQHEDRIWAARKTVEGLVNKLDVQNKKFGTICADNRWMKLEIKRMLWERDVFMRIWNKMIDKLEMGKKFMMDLIEQATIAYDQREEWCSKLQALRVKAHFDFIYHTQEMRELKRRQDNSKKLEHFYNTKGQRRVMKDLQDKEMFKRMENKAKLKERLAQYTKYMNEITEFTQENKIVVIARKFYQQEAENFSLFNRVNTLMEELEVFNDELGAFQIGIDEERYKHDLRAEQQKNTLQNLELNVEKVSQEIKDAQDELRGVEDYIATTLAGIETLFKICRCDKDPILKLLGDNTNTNIYNFFLYSKMIENVLNNALVEVYYTEKVGYEKRKITAGQRLVLESKKKEEVYPLERLVETNPCPLCIEYELVSDVIDVLQPVFDRNDAKLALQERLETTDISAKMHNVSGCFLPKSREIIQKRYQ